MRSAAPQRHQARLNIEVLEGRGVWFSLCGSLIDGEHMQVEDRLLRLARLGFETSVVDLRDLTEIDAGGLDMLRSFVTGAVDGRGLDGHGNVTVVDPTGVAVALREVDVAGLVVTPWPPEGTWWVRHG